MAMNIWFGYLDDNRAFVSGNQSAQEGGGEKITQKVQNPRV